MELHILIKVGFQIVGGGHLAHGLADPGDGQMPQDLVPDRIEPDGVVHTTQNGLGRVLQRPLHIRQHLPIVLFGLLRRVEIDELLASVAHDPIGGLTAKPLDLGRFRRGAEALHLTEPAAALVDDHDTGRAALVDLLAHKHAAKIVNFRGEAPKAPGLFLDVAVLQRVTKK